MHWFDMLLRTWEREHPGEKLSIRRLAGRAGVSKGAIERFKHGEGITAKNLSAIACVLGLSLDELLTIQQQSSERGDVL